MMHRGLLILGALVVLVFGSAIALYDSPIGWEQYFPMGLLAGAGWLLGGAFVRRRGALLLLHLTSAVALIIALVPFMLMVRFHFNPQQGDLYAMVHRQIDDERLTFRVRPNTWGHDANGFRNPAIPANPALIAIGDSQTWGINVTRPQTWPYLLAAQTGQPVYSMALGGYGPVEYWVLLGDALDQFSAETVVIGLYLGNDLYDAAQSVYLRETFAHLRAPGFADFPPTTVEKIADGSYSGEPLRTEFTAAYRLTGLDLDRPYVAEGLRLTRLLLAEMQQQASTAPVRLVVLLIPTKETVYAGRTDAANYPAYRRLVEMETRVRTTLITFFEAESIDYVDSLPALTAALNAGQPLFLTTSDGHFNATGCALLASVVDTYLHGTPD